MPVLRKQLRRAQVLAFFSRLPPCLVGLEACATAHYWARELQGDARLPDLARQVLQVLAAQIEQLEAAVAAIEKQLMAWHKSNPVSQRLASVPSLFAAVALCSRHLSIIPIVGTRALCLTRKL